MLWNLIGALDNSTSSYLAHILPNIIRQTGKWQLNELCIVVLEILICMHLGLDLTIRYARSYSLVLP